ncbi:hypothetical protein DMP17_06700 [Pseudonocardia sp. TMWB2A]|uniref:Panacea domain-containing protein n=1 Tax=Pseudonocardia sp. TMWB2A TaxID=687430 RepID=UPI00307D793F
MITFANRREMPIWNVSVQKLMYFAHASFLIRQSRPLIRGAFEAWEYGPVCRPVYNELKSYGREPITTLIQRVDPFTGEITMPALDGDIEADDHIAGIMRTMGHLHPNQLISLSHVRDGAWYEVWNKAKTGATVGNRISDKLTVERFHKLKLVLTDAPAQGGMDEATPFAGN